MKDLSIIIVNYNVRYFLQQCLESISSSQDSLKKSVFVVDNHSVDDSCAMIREHFPEVSLIKNKTNVGFGKANNQAAQISASKYILFLNPDTILSEDTLQNCFDYLEANPEVGVVGVPMFDGHGNFLPESKRGLPTTWSSFCKFSGLWRLFPKSKVFNRYYLGHLDKESNHEVEVLSGAFMFCRKKVLDEVGLFDEQFFMYGEDIDLSYRINEKGHKVVYLAESSIIHFKGESTKKASLDFTRYFYNSMLLFNKKHNLSKGALWNILISLSIILIGFFSHIKRLVSLVVKPLLDLVLIYFTFQGIGYLWSKLYWKDQNYYDSIHFPLLSFLMACLFVIIFFFNGVYSKRNRLENFLSGWLISIILLFLCYNFLPQEFRFSRAIILISSLSLLPILWLAKLILSRFMSGNWNSSIKKKKIIIVGDSSSLNDLKKGLSSYLGGTEIVASISPDNQRIAESKHGDIDYYKEVCYSLKPDELIFCAKDIAYAKMISIMSGLGNAYHYRIANISNNEILGSDSKDSLGIWYSQDLNINLIQKYFRNQKRLFDVLSSLLLILLFPFVLLLSPNRGIILKSIIQVLIGKRTWVGYSLDSDLDLPEIPKSIFNVSNHPSSSEAYYHQVIEYVNNFSIWSDFIILMKNLLPK